MNREEFVRTIISSGMPKNVAGHGFAPVNIALVKYWGKRDEELNLPTASSLSVTLSKGTYTDISWHRGADRVWLNEKELSSHEPFFIRLSRFLSLFRPDPEVGFLVKTKNEVPTRAGLASSASGFAALVMALNDLFGWQLKSKQLSLLARLGSGSACRSIEKGFVLWQCGVRTDGSDSFAEKLPLQWPELCLGILLVDAAEKSVGSKEGMLRTQNSSRLYPLWPALVEEDIQAVQRSIREKNFSEFGRLIETNAMTMHATMLSAWPPLTYWTNATLDALKKIWRLREQGLSMYATMDAGPNIKIFFLKNERDVVKTAFPELIEVELSAN